jgi:PIN domain nuclease of toxin-antitoxin system
MASAILDASAILAVLNNERGADVVLSMLDDAIVSAVNYAEVTSRLINDGTDRHGAKEAILSLGVQVADFDIELADRTGELRPLTRHRGLSLGDRACLALAERENAPVLTSDTSWRDVIPTVDVRIIR